MKSARLTVLTAAAVAAAGLAAVAVPGAASAAANITITSAGPTGSNPYVLSGRGRRERPDPVEPDRGDRLGFDPRVHGRQPAACRRRHPRRPDLDGRRADPAGGPATGHLHRDGQCEGRGRDRQRTDGAGQLYVLLDDI